jgi:hypothetical protein
MQPGVWKTTLPVELVIVNAAASLPFSDAARQTRSPTFASVETYSIPYEFEDTNAQSQLGHSPAVSVTVKDELPIGPGEAAHSDRLTD